MPFSDISIIGIKSTVETPDIMIYVHDHTKGVEVDVVDQHVASLTVHTGDRVPSCYKPAIKVNLEEP